MSARSDVLAQAARDADGRAEQSVLYAETRSVWWARRRPPPYQVLDADVVPARLKGVRPSSSGAPLT